MDDGSRAVDDARVEAAVAGDAAAIAQLFESLRPRLRRMIAHRIASRRVPSELVDELAQIVWAALTIALPRLEDRTAAGFGAFLSSIVQHKVADWIEARQRGRKIASLDSQVTGASELAERADFLPASQTTPSAAAARNERLALILRTIERLDPETRDVLLLTYVDQLDTAALAVRLGTTREAAAMRVLRATRDLRARLNQDDGHLSARSQPRGKARGTTNAALGP